MVTEKFCCYHCRSENIVKNGKRPVASRKDCSKQSRTQPSPNSYPEGRRKESLRAYEERGAIFHLLKVARIADGKAYRFLTSVYQ